MAVISIKGSSELALVPVQDTEKPECRCLLRLPSLSTSTWQVPKTTGCFWEKETAPGYVLGNDCSQHSFDSGEVSHSALWRQGEGRNLFPDSPQVLDCSHCPLLSHTLGQATLTTWLEKQLIKRPLACRLVDVM